MTATIIVPRFQLTLYTSKYDAKSFAALQPVRPAVCPCVIGGLAAVSYVRTRMQVAMNAVGERGCQGSPPERRHAGRAAVIARSLLLKPSQFLRRSAALSEGLGWGSPPDAVTLAAQLRALGARHSNETSGGSGSAELTRQGLAVAVPRLLQVKGALAASSRHGVAVHSNPDIRKIDLECRLCMRRRDALPGHVPCVAIVLQVAMAGIGRRPRSAQALATVSLVALGERMTSHDQHPVCRSACHGFTGRERMTLSDHQPLCAMSVSKALSGVPEARMQEVSEVLQGAPVIWTGAGFTSIDRVAFRCVSHSCNASSDRSCNAQSIQSCKAASSRGRLVRLIDQSRRSQYRDASDDVPLAACHLR